jgi:phosphotransferase system enzyme I (PtsP)
VLAYLSFVATPQPLGVLLDEAPPRIARCVGADVASLYLLEGDGQTLVMRGNVGFPERARGKVRLAVGEGITGLCVERREPIAAAHAPDHEAYRAFPELEEDRFPAFLAAPVLGPSGPLGAVAVQRGAEAPFEAGEICLVLALTAPISAAIRLARLLDELRDRPLKRAPPGGTRKVTLPGVPLLPGRALGAIAALQRPGAPPPGEARADDAARFAQALDDIERSLRGLAVRAAERRLSEAAALVDACLLMVRDQRLRDRTAELCAGGLDLGAALAQLARDATRTAAQSGDRFLMARAHDFEEVCDALRMAAAPDARVTLPQKCILVADHLGVYDLLVTAHADPAGVALTDRAPSARTLAIAELVQLPAIYDVAGAFRWISPGDLALLDGDHGFLVVNPSRAEVAAFRADRRRGPPSSRS